MILVTQSVEPVRASYTISLRILFKSNCPRWDRVIRISLLGGLMVALLPDMLNGSFWTISDWESLRAMLLRNGLIAILALVSVPLVVLFEALVMTLWLHHRLRPDQLRAWAEISPMGITLSTEDNDSLFSPWTAIRRVIQSTAYYRFETSDRMRLIIPVAAFSAAQMESLRAMILAAGVPADLR